MSLASCGEAQTFFPARKRTPPSPADNSIAFSALVPDARTPQHPIATVPNHREQATWQPLPVSTCSTSLPQTPERIVAR